MPRCWALTRTENANSRTRIFNRLFFRFVLLPGRHRPGHREIRPRNLTLGLLGQTDLERHFQRFPVKERRGRFSRQIFESVCQLPDLNDAVAIVLSHIIASFPPSAAMSIKAIVN